MDLDDVGKYILWIALFILALAGIYLLLRKIGAM
jgi:hypothetical protein